MPICLTEQGSDRATDHGQNGADLAPRVAPGGVPPPPAGTLRVRRAGVSARQGANGTARWPDHPGVTTAPQAELSAARATRGPGAWLAGFAVAVIIGHHVGTIFGPLGALGYGTEWQDWIDLLTPYAVVGCALAALAAAGADRRTWVLALGGTIAYVQGHGIHLAANSVSNALGKEQPIFLWDEVVGHYLWYGGLFVLVAALALSLLDRPATSAWRWPLALLFGLTSATNGIEGQTALFSLVVAIGFAAWGWRRRSSLLLASYGLTALLIAGWGIYWQGFPEFSELGWI